MSVVLLAARLLLAAVFAVAGAAKLADRTGSRRAAEAFGVPASLAGAAAVVLPLAELAVAALLLPAGTAWWSALAGLALLLAFTVAIAVSLARGRRPDCHCFGTLHAAPAGPGTLARNVALAGVAAVVVGAGADDAGPGAVGWIGRLEALEAVALGAVALGLAALAAAAALAVHLLRAHGRLVLRVEELEARLAEAGLPLPPTAGSPLGPGRPAPDFALPSLGPVVSLGSLLERGRPLLLVFSDPGCAPCRALAPSLAEWHEAFGGELELVVVSGGRREDVARELGGLPPERVLLEADAPVAVSVEYEAGGTPAAVVIGTDGRIAAGPAGGRAGVEELLGHALALARAGTERQGGLPPGTPAPALALPDAGGERVPLRASREHGAVVLFWSPDCSYCRAVKPDLLAWERDAGAGAPELLVVASAERDRAAAEGFGSRVLVDPGATAMAAFGATGTPMAVRLDAEGRVASPLAVGPDEVLALVRGERGAAPSAHGPSRAAAGA